ncbi:MAG: UbiA family prenyltransferase, partial [Bacillota bacterium]|nr:UbiA family prenyltransferase [Bacillota bacterium]
ALMTSPVVFLAGAACFIVGIVYTFGPAPISRMPLGEVFSGFFMGFFIPFLMVTINSPEMAPVRLTWQAPFLSLDIHLPDLISLLLLTVPPMMGIANIMLANNICDVTHDVAISRFTLPYYLGQKRSLLLFAALYLVSVAAIIAIALLDILPIYTLFTLVALLPLQKNIRRFFARQIKSDTFPLSVTNFILIVLPPIVITFIVIIIRMVR